MPLWIASLDATEHNDILASWTSILPDLVQLSRFKYFIRSEWTDMTTVKKIVKGLWAKTYHKIKLYVVSKRRAVTVAVRQEAEAEAAEEFASQVLASATEHILPLSNASIQQFLATLSNDSLSNFEISSAWITNDITDVADVAYNMIMFPEEPPAGDSSQDVD